MYEGVSAYYYENGQPITGWKEYLNPSNGINETYYFGDDGAAVSGWQTIGGKLYYFGTSGYYNAYALTHGARTNVDTPGYNGSSCDYVFDHGVPLSIEPGWVQMSSGEKCYYVSEGKLAQGWQIIEGKDYYFGANVHEPYWSSPCYMVTGPVYLSEYEGAYLFGADGVWYSQPGWAQLSTGERCYVNQDGKLALGLNRIDGKYYRFAINTNQTDETWSPGWGRWEQIYPTGALMTGKYEAWGKYLADEYGVVQVGWKTIEGNTYYFGESVAGAEGAKLAYGKSATGWMTIGGKVYYFSDNGAMLVGKQEIRGREQEGDPYHNGVYLFGDDGVLYENPGWLQMGNGDWYYINSDSTLATGWKDIDGESYYFGENGVMRTGFYWANGQQYWSDPSGVWHQTAWRQDSNGWWFDFGDGSYAQDSWQPIGNEWYHFDARGYMQVGWLSLGGVWYYLADSGAMHTGWLHNGGAWYYLNGSGDMATGWKNLSGTWYYLGGSGAMRTGWLLNGGAWYYLNGGGDMATGWRKVDGSWYYLNPSGDMATGWKNLSGTWYYLGGSGAMHTGWLHNGGAWYYLNSEGDMAENRWVGDYWVGSDGAMAVDSWVDGGRYYVGADGAYDPSARR